MTPKLRNGDEVVYKGLLYSYVGRIPDNKCLLFDNKTGKATYAPRDEVVKVESLEEKNLRLWREVANTLNELIRADNFYGDKTEVEVIAKTFAKQYAIEEK